jgi:hypothetical protein
LDINLPDAPDGEILDLVIAHKIPIFVFSSMMEDKLHKKVFSKPVIDYVLKGNTPSTSDLVKMVGRLIKEGNHRNTIRRRFKNGATFVTNLLKRYVLGC